MSQMWSENRMKKDKLIKQIILIIATNFYLCPRGSFPAEWAEHGYIDNKKCRERLRELLWEELE